MFDKPDFDMFDNLDIIIPKQEFNMFDKQEFNMFDKQEFNMFDS